MPKWSKHDAKKVVKSQFFKRMIKKAVFAEIRALLQENKGF